MHPDSLLASLNRSIRQSRKTAFYQKKLKYQKVDWLEQMEELEPTTKEELRSLAIDEMIAVSPERLYEYHESFGTTGTPTSTWFTKRDLLQYVDQLLESPVRFTNRDIVFIRFPYAISVPAHIFTRAVQNKGGCVVPVSRGSSIAPHTRVVKMMSKLNVTVLACMPYEAFMLAYTAQLLGMNPSEDFPALRALCVAGEMLSSERKKRLEQVWGVPVYNFYGTTEIGNIATSCQYGNLHASTNHFYLEVLHPDTNRKVDEREKGILHITTLTKEAFPLIRYDTGDLVQMPGIPCPCGRKEPVLIHHGRRNETVSIHRKEATLRELQEAFLALPASLAENQWVFRKTENWIEFIVETAVKDPCEWERYRHSIQLDLPYRIVPVPRNTLVKAEELLRVEPIGKPNYYADNVELSCELASIANFL